MVCWASAELGARAARPASTQAAARAPARLCVVMDLVPVVLLVLVPLGPSPVEVIEQRLILRSLLLREDIFDRTPRMLGQRLESGVVDATRLPVGAAQLLLKAFPGFSEVLEIGGFCTFSNSAL